MPTTSGMSVPEDRLRLPTKPATVESLGEDEYAVPGTQRSEQIEYTPELLSATRMQPLDVKGQTVSSTWAPALSTLTDWLAAPTFLIHSISPSPCESRTSVPLGSIIIESGSVRLSLVVVAGVEIVVAEA